LLNWHFFGLDLGHDFAFLGGILRTCFGEIFANFCSWVLGGDWDGVLFAVFLLFGGLLLCDDGMSTL
jgi:hypothetical protein